MNIISAAAEQSLERIQTIKKEMKIRSSNSTFSTNS